MEVVAVVVAGVAARRLQVVAAGGAPLEVRPEVVELGLRLILLRFLHPHRRACAEREERRERLGVVGMWGEVGALRRCGEERASEGVRVERAGGRAATRRTTAVEGRRRRRGVPWQLAVDDRVTELRARALLEGGHHGGRVEQLVGQEEDVAALVGARRAGW